jgi:hypothetical protein
MASGQSSTRPNGHNGRSAERDVPVQVMVPEKVRRQLAIMSAERGESIRLVHQFSSRFILIDPILAINSERPFHVCSRRRLETNSVAVEVESAAVRRLCVFRDGLRERVARLVKRIFACDGLRVPVKEPALAVDV